eukprot:TRINITY_DN24585_c0_g2_i2.p1 TRINITY_DN24585_c0_g2~~TRINITY_DN24585_c0_g2_i2.p1  ORF type:complete len:145 (-),score=7.41 TRINITY_DN24585_c0_g2_i2:52-462(-)
MELIFSLRQLIEKYIKKRKIIHMVFIDLEKANNRVSRDLICWVSDKRSIPRGCIDIIQRHNEGAITRVRTTYKETGEFSVTISLHRGSALSHYLFGLIMDKLTTHIQEEAPWCIVFGDDIMLVERLRDSLNAKLER